MNLYKIGWLYHGETVYKSASELCDIYNVNIIHLKKVVNGGHIEHFFWNKRAREIIRGKGSVKNASWLLSMDYEYITHPGDKKREVQLGDSVMVYRKFTHDEESLIFGYVTGLFFLGDKKALEITRMSLDTRIDGSTIRILYSESAPVFFLCDGINDRHEYFAPTNNLLKIKYKYQIDAAEFLIGNSNTLRIIREKYSKRQPPLAELAFRDVHRAMFAMLYPWGGIYRTHDVVVGDRSRETLPPRDIAQAMKFCFRRVSKPRLEKIRTKESVAMLLTELHKELAWIHPFEDGNGRAIRMYLLILSMSMGFSMDLSTLNGSKKSKTFYHYAVRKSIYDANNRYLYQIILFSLTEITKKVEQKEK
ncbi:Fic family protein [Pectobacterium polaris]|uniref:Fic family protein n=1 Tax=Pectobacterium polaris TaxID=2042057 RepID=UPI0023B18863|nr:Fic family protein [Pectobacterium polaris]MDE8755394.1 Fic family protein [Pectobacterium polaris]